MPGSLDSGDKQLSAQWIRGEPGEAASVNRELLDRITEALLERETLDRGELDLLVEGKPLPPMPLPVVDSPPVESPDTKEPAGFSGDAIPDPEPVPS